MKILIKLKQKINPYFYFIFLPLIRLHIVNDLTAEEPISTESYVCTFKELSVKAVNLDDLMKSVDGNLKSSELIVEFETKILRSFKDILYQKPMNESFEIINKDSPYPCLYKLFAQKG